MKQEKERTTVNETAELKRRQRRKSLLFYPAIGLLFPVSWFDFFMCPCNFMG